MQRAIVVGGTSGIGRCLVDVLVQRGYLVGATGRRGKLLNEMERQYTGKVLGLEFDIQSIQGVPLRLAELTEKLGGLDLMIISAGTGDLNEPLAFETEQNALRTNVDGFTRIAGWAWHFFHAQRYGHLVAITSIAGLRGTRLSPAYNATKAYQINYLEGLRQKAAASGLDIWVTDIRPGFIDTQMAKAPNKFWVASPQQAAIQIVSAIKREKRIAYVTRRWWLIAAVLRLMPHWLYERL